MPYIRGARNQDIESRLLGRRKQFAVLQSVPAQILGLHYTVASQERG